MFIFALFPHFLVTHADIVVAVVIADVVDVVVARIVVAVVVADVAVVIGGGGGGSGVIVAVHLAETLVQRSNISHNTFLIRVPHIHIFNINKLPNPKLPLRDIKSMLQIIAMILCMKCCVIERIW